jgi:hypothetical protein
VKERTVEVWFLTVLGVAALAAFLSNGALARRLLPRNAGGEPGAFERFWSRVDGRLLAVGWLALFALAVGDFGLVWSDTWRPVEDLFGQAQPVAAALLIPITLGVYLYKRAVPQVARDEADERERSVQGDVYRRTHTLVIAGIAITLALLEFNPAIGTALAGTFRSRHTNLIDVLLPAFLLLFMLPSVAYAWMYPRREDGSPGEPTRHRLPGWLSRTAAR